MGIGPMHEVSPMAESKVSPETSAGVLTDRVPVFATAGVPDRLPVESPAPWEVDLLARLRAMPENSRRRVMRKFNRVIDSAIYDIQSTEFPDDVQDDEGHRLAVRAVEIALRQIDRETQSGRPQKVDDSNDGGGVPGRGVPTGPSNRPGAVAPAQAERAA